MAGDSARAHLRLPGEIADVWGAGLPFPPMMEHREPASPTPPAEPPPALLDEFAADLDALLREQHKQLRSRLRDFVQAQRSYCAAVGVRCSGVVSDGDSVADSPLREVAGQGADCKQVPHSSFDSLGSMKSSHGDVQRDDDGGLMNGQIELSQVFQVASRTHTISREATARLAYRAKKGTDFRAKLLRMTGHWTYELALVFLIFCNTMCVAWETDDNVKRVRAGESSEVLHFQLLMCFFCIVFTVDLTLRLVAQGTIFFYSLDWKWNWFDIVVVLSAIFEVFFSSMLLSGPLTLRVVRVARLVRVARIGRALRSFMYFRDFRMTISMLVDSVFPLITFCVIMSMIVMVFAILITDGVSAHLASTGAMEDNIIKYFGTLLSTMLTLYMAVFGGIDWEVAYEPLMELSRLYRLIFVGYVFFVILAALNVLSAMFVDNTLQRSKSDRDFVVQTEVEGKREFLCTMKHLFEELDPDRSGTIQLHELQAHIMNPQVNAFFQAIDLNVFKVKELFSLIDVNKSGGIDRNEFVEGCSRLRGEAKELDVAILQYEVKALSETLHQVKNMLKQLGQRIDPTSTATQRRSRNRSIGAID